MSAEEEIEAEEGDEEENIHEIEALPCVEPSDEDIIINPALRGYRCASHTLQLAVLDSLKLTTANNTLIMARKVVKSLCNQTIMMCIR